MWNKEVKSHIAIILVYVDCASPWFLILQVLSRLHRYMAPEVATLKQYGFGCDVYSFSIMLWEICSLRRAYDNVSLSAIAFHKHVVQGHMRPSLRLISSPCLRNLLTKGWDKDPCVRPAFRTIVKVLEERCKEESLSPLRRSKSINVSINGTQSPFKKLLTRTMSSSMHESDESIESISHNRRSLCLHLDLTKRNRRFQL